MNNFKHELNGWKTKIVHYSDTDNLKILKTVSDISGQTKLVVKKLCKGKDDYKWWFFQELCLAPNWKNCLTIDQHCNIEERGTFEAFTDSQRLLDGNRYF